MKVWSILNSHGYDLAPNMSSSAPTLAQELTVRVHQDKSIEPNRVRIARPRPLFIVVDSEWTAKEVLLPL
jgi:hypothetical protein